MEMQSAEVISQWRNEAGEDHPAGPLFSSAFAEAEIASESSTLTIGGCGTACTGSYTRYCC